MLLGNMQQQLELDPASRDVYTIGRSERCDLRIEHSTVSRHHAVIFYENGTWYISDMSSGNGVKVDRRPANSPERNRTPFHRGSRIQLSSEYTIRVD